MRKIGYAAGTVGFLSATVAGLPAQAQDLQLGGYIRSETAFATGDANNPFNQDGNQFNGVTVLRDGAVVDTTTRNGPREGQIINLQLFRAELDATLRISDDWSATGKLRAVADPGWYNEFDPSDVGSRSAGDTTRSPNYFGYAVRGDNHPNPLEFAGRNYDIDFPALFLEYNHGPLDLRVGNQQIAWGQAIFFRVLDVPDGLDLRRHSVLDYVPEEYSDKRVPALAVRATYQIDENWLIDGFVQKFQPTVLANYNTPYNPISSQFTVHDRYAQFNADLDEGIRLKGQVGDFGVQAIYAHRYNPDGVYRWAASGVNRDIPGLPGSGQVLQGTPFEVDSTGVWSHEEWFNYAARQGLKGIEGLDKSITDFTPYTSLLGAVPVSTFQQASHELDQFFQLAGGLLAGTNNAGLRGHIEREYRVEDDFGAGFSYVTQGEPGSILDQLIVNVEALYVPRRTFTSPDLGHGFLTKSETTVAVVLEKYQRFSQDFPATYMVGQFIYKSTSDLFGRYLGGLGGTTETDAPGYAGGFKAIALAVQQPFPNLVWRFDAAALYDIKGSLLLQPAIRWKPNGNVTMELFYNYINAKLGTNPYKTLLGGSQYANEVTLRLSYQF